MRAIPTITKNLLIINVLMFLATWVFGLKGIELSDYLGLHFFMAGDFRIYQFITYMFMHGGFQHIFFNMFALWMFGVVVENTWGPKKFLFYYIVCGIGAGTCAIQQLCHRRNGFVPDCEHRRCHIADGSIPQSVEHCGCFGCGVWHPTRFRNALSGAAYIHFPTAGAYQSQMVRDDICCDRTLFRARNEGRRYCPFCPPRRYVVRLAYNKILETTSRLRLLRRSWRAVLRQHETQMGDAKGQGCAERQQSRPGT